MSNASATRSTGTAAGPGPFLDRMSVTHGPPDILAPYFLYAVAALKHLGIELEFGTFQALAGVNRDNFASWGRLVTMLDCRVAAIPPERAFCLLGRNAAGETVVTQAARAIDLTGTDLAHVVETNQLFYPDCRPPASERCEVAAPFARTLTGEIAYSGALWIRPDCRGRGLSSVMSRLTRACAVAFWGSPTMITFVRDDLVEKGIAAGYGYRHFERGFRRFVDGRLDFAGSFVWVSDTELFSDLEDFVMHRSTRRAGGLRHTEN